MQALGSSPLVLAVSWALLHSLWQATVAALALRVTLALLPARAAGARYGAAALALAASVCVPLVTAVVLARAEPGSAAFALAPITVPALAGVAATVAAVAAGTAQGQAAGLLAVALPLLLLVWAVVAGVALVRVLGGVVLARRVVARGTEAPRAARVLLDRLAREQRMRSRVRLVMGAASASPAAVGLGRATVVLPRQALTELSDPELESVLLHELAHLRRHDSLAALLQALADALLAGNPAARWISRHLRTEREHRCDDDVVARKGSLCYARTLVRLDGMSLARTPLGLAADGTPLLERVRRLAAPAPPRPGTALVAGMAGALVLALGTGLLVTTVRALPASGVHMTIRAQDLAGSFTIALAGHRVVGATLDQRPVPRARLRLDGDSLRFLDPAGRGAFSVRLLRAGGITWHGRSPAR